MNRVTGKKYKKGDKIRNHKKLTYEKRNFKEQTS